VTALPSIQPTGGPVGAEVRLDLARDPPNVAIHAILRALVEHRVLLFRDQVLSEARLLEVSAWFGPVYRPPAGFPMLGGADQPAIVKLSNTEAGGVAGSDPLPMHSDLHNMPFPADISLLYAVEVPGEGGETSWSDLERAYDELDPALRIRLDGVRGSSPNPYTGGAGARARRPPDRSSSTSTVRSRSSRIRWCARIRSAEGARCTWVTTSTG
jgi:taurine dioxygenase